jgi:hypothetical protein
MSSTHRKKFQALIQDAIAQPEHADLINLWQQLDQILEQLPEEIWLQVAGEAIAQLADVCAARAECLLEEWQARHNPVTEVLTEPVLTDDLLGGILRHSMSLNLENLLEDLPPQQRNRHPSPNDSIVGNVDKTVVLTMLDQMELKQTALQTAYEESISEWSATVQQWVEEQTQPVTLESLLRHSELSPVKVWLGLLLANPAYQWEHQWKTDQDFYSPHNVRLLPHPQVLSS